MLFSGVLPMLLLAASAAPAGELRIEVRAHALVEEGAKASFATGTHELGYAVQTETRYRVLPDGRVEVYCTQSARPNLQGAVHERRLAKPRVEER